MLQHSTNGLSFFEDFFTGNKKVTEFLQLFFWRWKKEENIKTVVALEGMCIRTNADFYRHIGNRINAEKRSTKEKKRCLLKANSPNWAPNATQRESLFFASIFSFVSFWSFPIQEKGDCSLLEPTSSKGKGGDH